MGKDERPPSGVRGQVLPEDLERAAGALADRILLMDGSGRMIQYGSETLLPGEVYQNNVAEHRLKLKAIRGFALALLGAARAGDVKALVAALAPEVERAARLAAIEAVRDLRPASSRRSTISAHIRAILSAPRAAGGIAEPDLTRWVNAALRAKGESQTVAGEVLLGLARLVEDREVTTARANPHRELLFVLAARSQFRPVGDEDELRGEADLAAEEGPPSKPAPTPAEVPAALRVPVLAPGGDA